MGDDDVDDAIDDIEDNSGDQPADVHSNQAEGKTNFMFIYLFVLFTSYCQVDTSNALFVLFINCWS